MFEQLYRTHYRTIENYVRGHFPGIDEADVISHTFETAWRRFDQIPPDATCGWLIGVARNWARNSARSARRRSNHLDAFVASRSRWHQELHDHDTPPETLEALERAFRSLQPADQEIVLLASWNGLSGADLGAAIGTSSGTASVRLFRARQRLHEAFSREGGEP